MKFKKEITDQDYADLSNRVGVRVIQLLEELSPGRIHSFLPIKKNREPDTFPILSSLLEKGKKVYISKTDFETKTMSHFKFDLETKLGINSFGIPEPIEGHESFSLDVDLFLIPLVAFDTVGNRLGYGGGYYDRLLAENQKSKKVGLSILRPQETFNFVESHDIKLDFGVTPYETLRC